MKIFRDFSPDFPKIANYNTISIDKGGNCIIVLIQYFFEIINNDDRLRDEGLRLGL